MSSLDGLSPKLEDPMHDQLWLFNDTIDALLPYSDDIPIFIKPHVYTNIELLKKIVNDKKNVFITYLHPTLLAMKARLFICNQFSNVMADGHSLGVTTIEYTNYNKELLNATSGESVDKQFVSYFINNNYAELKNIISNIAESSHKSFYYRGISDDKSGLLESIVSKR